MKELSLKEIQIKSLEILRDIDKICRLNSIKYCIIFGTLLGAIRHSGFIPWDDDIDIGMTRTNYNKFLMCYKKTGKFRIVNPQTESKCPYMISRISDDRFKMETKYGPKYAIGTFVDIYPFDGIGNNYNLINKIVRLSTMYSRGLSRSLEYNPFVAVKGLHYGVKKWLLLGTYILPKINGSNFYRKRLTRLTRQYSYINSAYVGCVIWALRINECYKKEWLEDIIDMEFEGVTVMVPRNYDEMLRHSFGDYMQLPPLKDRISHHFYSIYEVSQYNPKI